MNKLQKLGEDIKTFPSKMDKYHQIYMTVLGAPILGGAILQWIFLALFKVSPWLSILAILLCFIAVYIIYMWNNATIRSLSEKNYTKQIDYLIVGMFVAQGIIAVVAISNLSYLLYSFRCVDYIKMDSQPFNGLESIDNYTRFYFWYFFNSIPGVDCNSFNWHQQIRPNNFLSGFIVFIVQVYVTFIFIGGIKDWLDNRNLKKQVNRSMQESHK
ncbi:MAG TPA: hypothetical protein VJY62_13620 [Bacteroidia bacterium]|nr:hypothetical protein [Bacteroidia bacterium]